MSKILDKRKRMYYIRSVAEATNLNKEENKMKYPTTEDRLEAIKKLQELKSNLLKYSAFGSNNHILIDAQLDLIEDAKDCDSVLNDYGLDNLQESELCNTMKWLSGNLSKKEFFGSLECKI